jgi:hypothetical protein
MRGITETDRFCDELRRMQPDARRADELIDGVKWILGKNPRDGVRAAPESSVWMAFSNEYSSVEPAVVYYTFDAETVFLLSIVRTERPDNHSLA